MRKTLTSVLILIALGLTNVPFSADGLARGAFHDTPPEIPTLNSDPFDFPPLPGTGVQKTWTLEGTGFGSGATEIAARRVANEEAFEDLSNQIIALQLSHPDYYLVSVTWGTVTNTPPVQDPRPNVTRFYVRATATATVVMVRHKTAQEEYDDLIEEILMGG